MFGLKGRDTFNKPRSSSGQIMEDARKWWMKLFPCLIFALFVLIIVVIGNIWYSYVYVKGVSEQEKQEYINKKNKEAAFKKEKYDNLKQVILKRGEHFNTDRVEYTNIFYVEKKVEQEDEESEEE